MPAAAQAMPATIQAPGQQSPLDDTIGSMFIGVIVSAVLYGVSLVQAFYYYRHYPKDAWFIKALVTISVVFDLIHLVMITATVYHYVITEYYNPLALGYLTWSVLLEALFTGISGVLVQCFYAYRVWRLSNRNILLVGSITILVLGNGACGTAWVVISMQLKTYEDLLKISSLTLTINALSVVIDMSLAVSLCIMLNRARTGFKQSDNLITKMILFTVNTGLLTSLFAIASLIALALSPRTLIYAPFYFCIGRLYSNSLLATLNVRRSSRDEVDEIDHMMVSFPTSTGSRTVTSTANGLSSTKNIAIRIETTKELSRDVKSSGSISGSAALKQYRAFEPDPGNQKSISSRPSEFED